MRRYDDDICLLADSGYGITPFDEPRNAREPNFNLTHAEGNVIIERVFGLLLTSFSHIVEPSENSGEKCSQIGNKLCSAS